ncbi:MAG: hypothetical protein WA290_17855, partial [Mycobacterium sp.]
AALENILMPASLSENHVNCEQLPPLAAEDHTCADCALAYSEIDRRRTTSATSAESAASAASPPRQ